MRKYLYLLLLLFIPVLMGATYTSPRHGVTLFEDVVAKGPWIDVRAYGAVGDGVTDDSTAVEAAALAAYNGTDGVGVLFFPAGNYIMTVILGTGVEDKDIIIQGSGAHTIITAVDPGEYAITLDFPGGFGRKVKILDIAFDGDSKTKNGITFNNNIGQVSFDNVRFENHGRAVYKPNGNFFLTFDNCEMQGNDYGMYAIASTVSTMHAGLDKFLNGYIADNDIVGYYIDDDSTVGGGQTLIQDTVIEGNPGFGVFARNLWGLNNPSLHLNRVWWEDNGTAGAVTVTHDIGSTEESLAPTDIYLDNAKQVHISNGKIVDISMHESPNLLISGNQQVTYSSFDNSSVLDLSSKISDQPSASTLEDLGFSFFPTLPFRETRYGTSEISHRNGIIYKQSGEDLYNYLGIDLAVDAAIATTIVNTEGLITGSANQMNLAADSTVDAGISVTIPAKRWYLLTLAMKNPDGEVKVDFGGGLLIVNAPASDVWKTYASIRDDYTPTVFNSRTLTFQEMSSVSQTVHVSEVQMQAFATQDEMLSYLQSGLYSSPKGIASRKFAPLPFETTTTEGTFVYYDGSAIMTSTGKGFYSYDGSSWLGPVATPSYASIYASSETITINTTNTDTLGSAGWVVNETTGPAYNGTTGVFTIQSGGAGTYKVGFSVSFSGGNNDVVHWHLFHNGAENNALEAERKLSAAGDVGDMGISNDVTVAVGDTLKLMTQQDTTTTNQVVNHGSFWIQRMGQ